MNLKQKFYKLVTKGRFIYGYCKKFKSKFKLKQEYESLQLVLDPWSCKLQWQSIIVLPCRKDTHEITYGQNQLISNGLPRTLARINTFIKRNYSIIYDHLFYLINLRFHFVYNDGESQKIKSKLSQAKTQQKE